MDLFLLLVFFICCKKRRNDFDTVPACNSSHVCRSVEVSSESAQASLCLRILHNE